MATIAHREARVNRTILPPSWLRVLTYVIIIAVVLCLVFPFYWLLQTSFKPIDEIYSAPPTWFPQTFITSNYSSLFTEALFSRAMLNSLIVATATTVLSAFLSSIAGFAFAKYRFRGRNILFLIVLGSMMVPIVVTLVPNYILFAQLRLTNTLWSVILPASISPFAIFWMRQYIASAVPDSLLEAARLEGADEFQIFWRIVRPIITPGLAALAIWVFVQSWNEFLRPLVYLQQSSAFTVPLALSSLRFATTQFRISLDLISAAAVLSCIPVLLLFALAQDKFVSGATTGAVRE
jgi:ABC-type glycerol-3-phosphate transport system permease component